MYDQQLVGADGIAASAKITFPALPAPGDTVTINGVIYTFGTDFFGTKTPVLNGPAIFTDRDQAALAANLANTIRVQNGNGFTAYPEGPVLWVVALGTGAAANSWTLATSNSSAITVPGTFSGGVDGSAEGGGSTVPVALTYANPLALSSATQPYVKCLLSGDVEIYFSNGGTDGQEVQLMLLPTSGDSSLTLSGIVVPSESTYTNPKTLTSALVYILKFKYSQDAGSWMLLSLVGGYSGY